MSANDERTPSHYTGGYQHWDLVIKVGMDYLEGCTTKYVTRWRKKNGFKDLEKAYHYLDKIIEIANTLSPLPIRDTRILSLREIKKEVTRYCLINDLSILEQEYIHLICTYKSMIDLVEARAVLQELLEEASLPATRPEPNYPGTPEDGGHHEVGNR